MSFREKIAWVSLLTTGTVYGWYFLTAHPFSAGSATEAAPLLRLAVLLTILQIVPITVMAALSPRDAKAPLDEREALIALKASRAGYAVLVAGALASCVAGAHFGIGGIVLANGILAALVSAELAKQAFQILHYRRGV